MRCPHCSAKYGLEDIHYLGQLDSMTFLHMRCSQCHTPVFASVALANKEGEVIPTDITAEDVAVTDSSLIEPELQGMGFEQRTIEVTPEALNQTVPVEDVPADKLMASLNPVAYDDVLDTHEYLKKFEGDFEKIFEA